MSENGDPLLHLSPEAKRALLVELLSGGRNGGGTLSVSQERYWVLHRMDPTLPTHVAAAYDVRGPLDVGRLQAALRSVVERHEILRTKLVAVEAEPRAVVVPASFAEVPVTYLDGLAPPAQADELARIVAEQARRPFDPAVSLMRTTLVRLGPERHVFVLVLHQLIADRASAAVVVGELATAYATFANGQATTSPRAAQFAAFAAEQRAAMQTARAEDDLAACGAHLADVPVLQLPTDRPRPAVKASGLRGACRVVTLPGDLVRALDTLGAARADAFAVVLAAWEVLLARHGGRRDFALGVPVPNRSAAWSQAIGPFENTLVLRADLAGDPTFTTLLERARAECARARSHSGVPLERLIQSLQPGGDVTHSPLFQVQIAYEEAELFDVAQLRWERLDVETGLAAFDLTLRVRRRGPSVSLELEYATDLFEAAAVDKLLAHLQVLLHAAAADSHRPISALPMAGDDERQRLARWNDTAAANPAERCVHELIERQTRQAPDAPAVFARDGALSYRELGERANALAHRLRALGAGPEVLVGVVADRSAATIVALLAVLKSGGAYVPLDPELPPQRLAFILDDAQIGIVLASPALARKLALGERTVVDPSTAEMLPDAPRSAVGPENLAYAIYTSGSTGQPKGVLTEHRQIVNATVARFDLMPQDMTSYLTLAPLMFDAAAAGIYWTLCAGGRLVLPDDEQVKDPRLIAQLIRHQRISHLDAGIPSQYAVLLDTKSVQLPELLCCIVAGEALPPALVARHVAAGSQTPLFNEYGPTEATVWTTAYRCTAAETRASVPIGRPIRNVRVHVLDDDLRPQPIGVPGELYVAGDGLARGYLNRPALTAESFVPDPFASVPGQRLYGTGDLARFLPDGNVEFLGRADSQVKVRGYRVELGEIDAVLQGHPDVATAVTLARNGRAGDTQLVAYVVPRDGAQLAAEALGAFAGASLPGYMVPTRFEFLAELPRNASGKLDRAALPQPSRAQDASTLFEKPMAKAEREIASVFADVLGVEHVGLHDDFFALGGNSLLIARVGARLCEAYQVDLPLHSLFTIPTVAGVSRTIDVFSQSGYAGVLAERDPRTLIDEAELDPSITPENLPLGDILAPAAVLLTGATGYLGVFLLEQLIRQTRADVYCLVRAASSAEGTQRLKAAAETFKVSWDAEFDARVRPVLGDLTKPELGLTPEAYAHLAATVDAIYHNGALVNFVYPYSVLKPTNVTGTVEVLRLACRVKAKIVHHVSTIDVLVGSHIPRPFLERDLPEHPPRMPFSYPQSKWIAEKMVVEARSRGLPVTIIRPSMIMGHSVTGACHKTDYILIGLRGFLELGILPEYEEIMHAMTVDYASKALVHLSLQPSSVGRLFHLWNTHALPTMWTYDWVRSFGYEFEIVPFDDAIDAAMNVDPSHPIYPLLPVMFLYKSGDAGIKMEWEDHLALDPRSECAHTLESLEGSGIECPQLTERWMHDCLTFLIERGELKPPSAIARKSAVGV